MLLINVNTIKVVSTYLTVIAHPGDVTRTRSAGELSLNVFYTKIDLRTFMEYIYYIN